MFVGDYDKIEVKIFKLNTNSNIKLSSHSSFICYISIEIPQSEMNACPFICILFLLLA